MLLDLNKEEIKYLLEVLYEKKRGMNLKSVEEEQRSEEYQLNQSLRVKLEHFVQD